MILYSGLFCVIMRLLEVLLREDEDDHLANMGR